MELSIRQNARSVVLVRPNYFGYNPETAVDNTFMTPPSESGDRIAVDARREFDAFAMALREAGVDIATLADQTHVICPDAIYPNNWVTTYHSGLVVAHPMAVPSRRQERQRAILDFFREQPRFERLWDLSGYEEQGRFLEGTGSIVYDHLNKIAYACISQRTDPGLLETLCAELQYRPAVFTAVNESGKAVYHTNVVMAVGEKFAVVCSGAISRQDERENILGMLRETREDVIEISLSQMNHFVGNMIQVESSEGDKVIALSTQAFDNLTPEQKRILSSHGSLVHSSLETIETYGGGSARCMIAENFLTK